MVQSVRASGGRKTSSLSTPKDDSMVRERGKDLRTLYTSEQTRTQRRPSIVMV
jgi:hypothetical protein